MSSPGHSRKSWTPIQSQDTKKWTQQSSPACPSPSCSESCSEMSCMELFSLYSPAFYASARENQELSLENLERLGIYYFAWDCSHASVDLSTMISPLSLWKLSVNPVSTYLMKKELKWLLKKTASIQLVLTHPGISERTNSNTWIPLRWSYQSFWVSPKWL